MAHSYAQDLDLNAVGKTEVYDGWFGEQKAYAISKSCNILHSLELDRRLQEEGIDVRANSCHPGVISTDLTRHMNLFSRLSFKILAYFGKNIQQGAATTVYLAASPDVENIGGKYFSDCALADTYPHITAENAKKLWEISESMVESIISI